MSQSKSVTTIRCKLCGETFIGFKVYRAHLKAVHYRLEDEMMRQAKAEVERMKKWNRGAPKKIGGWDATRK